MTNHRCTISRDNYCPFNIIREGQDCFLMRPLNFGAALVNLNVHGALYRFLLVIRIRRVEP
jgi:hypothetical protein